MLTDSCIEQHKLPSGECIDACNFDSPIYACELQVEARLKKLEMQIKILLRGQSDVSLEAGEQKSLQSAAIKCR